MGLRSSVKFLLAAMAMAVSTAQLNAPVANAFAEYKVTAYSGNVSVNGSVAAKNSITPPTISSPRSNTSTSKSLIEVKGTCEPSTIVVIYVNGTMSGTTHCATTGKYVILAQLYVGKNKLYVKSYDSLARISEASSVITITYKPTTPPTNSVQNPNVKPLKPTIPERPVLCSAYSPSPVTEGGDSRVAAVCLPSFVEPNKKYVIGVMVTGGIGPYAVSIDWGDRRSEPSLYSFEKPGYHAVTFGYDKPGAYVANIRLVDQTIYGSFTQVAVIVNGGLVSPEQTLYSLQKNTSWLYGTAPFYWIIGCLLLGFWGGYLLRRYQLK